MSSVTIHPLDDHARIQWPERAQQTQSWFSTFFEHGISACIPNVWADVFFAINDTHAVPLTRTQKHPKNSYVCSPYSHYITYALTETQKLEPKWLGRCLETVLHRLGRYLQRGEFEPTVYVNNWLLSTNLYEAWPTSFITQLHHALVTYFPQTPIAFRSVDSKANATLMNHLISLGYQPVFSRFVWYQDPHDRSVYRKKSYLRDGQIFKRSRYTVRSHGSFTREDYSRAARLYSMLYIEKYSEMNPKFSATFLRSQCMNSHLELRGLFKDGQMDAVYGFYTRNGLGTCPIFGYDTTMDPKVGLYRSLSWLWAEEAKDLKVHIHASSGVGAFKRHRGAIPEIEYNMVFTGHLPRYMKRRWHLLALLAKYIAVPLIKRQEL